MSTKRPKAPPNTYWRGPVLWGRTEIAGHLYRWSLRTGDVKVARQRVKTECERIKAERHFGEQRHSYPNVFAEWSEHIVTQVGPGTAQRYAVSLAQLEPELMPLFIDEIDKGVVVAIVKRRRGGGVTTATIRRDLTALSSILEFAEDRDYREGNPALARLRKLKERRNPIVLPHHADIECVAAAAGAMIGAMTRTALAGGFRQSELVYAERRNFDYERRQLTVRGKRNKLRTVELDEATAKILRALPVCLGQPWLFWQGDGEPFRGLASTFRYIVRAQAKAAQESAQKSAHQFRRFTFHHLRHRHAVDWLKSGRSLYDLQKRLGHTSIKTTEIYLDFLTPEEERIAKGEVPQKSAHSQRSTKGKTS